MSFLAHNKANLAIIISIVALLWNVYRDFLLKPRCRVRFKIAELHSQAQVVLRSPKKGLGSLS